jgi:hypothetical protein
MSFPVGKTHFSFFSVTAFGGKWIDSWPRTVGIRSGKTSFYCLGLFDFTIFLDSLFAPFYPIRIYDNNLEKKGKMKQGFPYSIYPVSVGIRKNRKNGK